MLVHELGGLHAAQQLVGVASDVGGSHLIGHDLAFRIDDEIATFGHAVRLVVGVEVTRQLRGRVGEHRILDLGDLLAGVMPSLVHELGVAGNGVDLAADLLEVLVLVGKVLKLGRAHEREVGRVEEEHRPMTEHIGLAHLVEVVILVGVDGEVRQFMLQQRHLCSFPLVACECARLRTPYCVFASVCECSISS